MKIEDIFYGGEIKSKDWKNISIIFVFEKLLVLSLFMLRQASQKI